MKKCLCKFCKKQNFCLVNFFSAQLSLESKRYFWELLLFPREKKIIVLQYFQNSWKLISKLYGIKIFVFYASTSCSGDPVGNAKGSFILLDGETFEPKVNLIFKFYTITLCDWHIKILTSLLFTVH